MSSEPFAGKFYSYANQRGGFLSLNTYLPYVTFKFIKVYFFLVLLSFKKKLKDNVKIIIRMWQQHLKLIINTNEFEMSGYLFISKEIKKNELYELFIMINRV